MRLRRLLGLAAGVVLLAAVAPARAEPLTPEQKAAVEALIRDTIANHPEIVLDALRAEQLKDRKAAAETVRQAIVAQRGALLSDASSPVGGNPKGDVTIVEFFDYRCPYCKEVEPSLEALLKEDGRLRIVYKEFPILGPASVYAARVALAARAQGKYEAFHRTMMAVKGTIDEDTVRRTAAGAGLDMEKIAGAVEGDGIDGVIQTNYALAESLEIDGTPAFIVGDTMLPGVVDIDTLRKVVAKVRKGG
jgi:protein-disulfide isomerase